MDKLTGNGIEGLFHTYKDVKLATEVVGDLSEQMDPLVPHGEVAEPPGPCLPLLEVLTKLSPSRTTCARWPGPQRTAHLMCRVPPVTRAILPCSAHLTGTPIVCLSISQYLQRPSVCFFQISLATGLSMCALDC